MAKGDDIQARLIKFAVRIMRVCDSLHPRRQPDSMSLVSYCAAGHHRHLIMGKDAMRKVEGILSISSALSSRNSMKHTSGC